MTSPIPALPVPTREQCLDARCALRNCADSALLQWYEHKNDFHARQLIEELQQAVSALGLRLVAADEPAAYATPVKPGEGREQEAGS